MNDDRRWAELEALQKEYAEFRPFLYDVITGLLGFQCTPLQLDIATYLERGPLYRMIQAQRGQAKTTITAIYAVWRLIHDPTTRIVIVTAGGTLGEQIANWIIQIINGMDELTCLRPDKTAGDRTSVKAFDIHNALKGPEKSPSIACFGITSSTQGFRADLLIADDVESAKNSQTEHQRMRIEHLTRDFTSVCEKGDIVYLGTPQSTNSIYNGLASRGYDIRIWPGRYPTEEEEENYGEYLAPSIKKAMREDPGLRSGGGPVGDRGQPTDPILMPEEVLTKKELDQGSAYFQLQYMLDTSLLDKDRFPLKPSNLVFMKVGPRNAPIEINFQPSEDTRIYAASDFPIDNKLYRASSYGKEFGKFQGTVMYVDPAGGGRNGDETAYAVTRFLAGYVFLVDIGAVKGGYELDTMQELAEVAKKWEPHTIQVEENYGKGAFKAVWQPVLHRVYNVKIEDVWESGQKELRIIDTLEPVINAQRLIVDEEVLAKDWKLCQQYPAQNRSSFSLFYQIARITRDKGSLVHDDRLDALAGAVRYWKERLAVDNLKQASVISKERYRELINDPLGSGRFMPPQYKRPNTLNKMKRRF